MRLESNPDNLKDPSVGEEEDPEREEGSNKEGEDEEDEE